nr:helix-turn-helix domain-containing protein [Bdellovibrio sp. HAGR004]
MAKNKSLEVCPVYKTSEILEGKWTILIFRDLLAVESVRFNELRRSLGSISPKTLTERLTFMELQGMIERKVYAEVPPRVEYSLTEKGRGLSKVFDSMAEYGAKWLD